MGSGISWQCEHCNFEGHELFGMGFAGVDVESVWCPQCQELQERTARYPFDNAPDGFEVKKNCVECGSELQKFDSKKPCPKCGEGQLVSVGEILWD